MFEKEAYEWTEKNISVGISMYNPSIEMYCGKAFKDGAEFGFQKGLKAKINTTTISDCPIRDEWHYVKDGDLPLDDSFVLVWTEYGGITTNYGKEYSDGIPENGLFKGIHISDVIAWKEFVPPKED